MCLNAVIAAGSSAVASSLTYSARENADMIVKKGVEKVVQGTNSMKSGSRYWKGTAKKGVKIVQNGVYALNVSRGQASTIGTSISFVIGNIKTFFGDIDW